MRELADQAREISASVPLQVHVAGCSRSSTVPVGNTRAGEISHAQLLRQVTWPVRHAQHPVAASTAPSVTPAAPAKAPVCCTLRRLLSHRNTSQQTSALRPDTAGASQALTSVSSPRLALLSLQMILRVMPTTCGIRSCTTCPKQGRLPLHWIACTSPRSQCPRAGCQSCWRPGPAPARWCTLQVRTAPEGACAAVSAVPWGLEVE